MPVTGGVTRNDYIASAGQTIFAYTFEILSNSDIKVLLNGAELSIGSDYSVTGVGADGGGNVLLVAPTSGGDKIALLLAMPITRTTNYQNSGDFLASDVNADFDKTYIAMNQLQTDISRSIGLQDEEDSATLDLPLAANRANKVLGFDGNGNVIATTSSGGGGGDFLPLTGGDLTGPVTTTSTFDGRDVSADGTKLDGIEAGATADQTAAEIKTAYESNADTNAFTDADETKLDGIEAGADVTDTTNVVASLSAGTGISLSAGGEIANTAPDQVVALTGSGGTTVTGTYPSFTITSTGGGGGNETLAQTLVLGNTTGGTDIAFADNDKATFGGNTDLEIYHDGTNSYVVDDGTGNLFIGGSSYVDIGNGVLGAGGQTYARFNTSGSCQLNYNNVDRLETTSSGILVNGTVNGRNVSSDGAKLDGVEALADVTDTDNVVASLTAGTNITIAGDGTISSTGGGGGGETLAQTLAIGNTTGGTDIAFGDNDKATFGANTDLEIYHDGSNSYVVDDGTGNLFIGGASYVDIGNGVSGAGGQTYARFNTSGSCQLNHNGVNRLTTTASGVDINGDISLGDNNKGTFGAADDLEIFHDGSNSYVADYGTGNLFIGGSNYVDIGNGIDGVGGQTYARFNTAGSCQLNYNGVDKLATTASGVDVNGNINVADNSLIQLGTSNDLELLHDGSNSYIRDTGTGNLFVGGAAYVDIGNGITGVGGQTYARFNTAGSCDLKYNNVQKMSTTATGIDVSGNVALTGTVDGRDVSADGTKLDGIEAGADVTDTANVTAAGALMDSEVTNLAQVKAFDSSDYATAAQGTTADAALPKAGGTMTGTLAFGDNVKATFGDEPNLEISHNGTHSVIEDIGGGSLFIKGGPQLKLFNDTETAVLCQKDGAVTLYHNNVAKVATSATGVSVTGEITADGLSLGDNDKATFGNSDDLEIYHDGSNSYITDTGTGNLFVGGSSYVDIGNGVTGAGGQTYARFNVSGACQLNYNGVDKLKTISTGANITGSLGINTTSPSEELHVVGDIIATGNITAFFSDERLKDFQGTIPDALDKVNSLNGYYFTPNDTALGLGVEDKGVEVGISAQEVEAVLPEIVTDSAVGEGYKTVWYEKLTPLLIEAVKELTDKVDDLEARLKELEK